MFCRTMSSKLCKISRLAMSGQRCLSQTHIQHSMIPKITVAIDMDDVLGQFAPSLCAFYNETVASKRGLPLMQTDEIHTWDLQTLWHTNVDETADLVNQFYDSDYFLNIKPIAGARECLVKHAHKFNYVIVTSRQLRTESNTRQWLTEYFGPIFADVRLGNHHFPASGPKISKPDMCHEVGAYMLIDDSLTYALQCSQTLSTVMLFDWKGKYGWNKCDDLPHNVARAMSWKDISNVFDFISVNVAATDESPINEQFMFRH